MYNVKEVIVEYTHFLNPKASDDCSLAREDISTLLVKELQNSGVPAIAVNDAKPPVMGNARIQMVPEIYSINSEGLDCTSWVSLVAETKSNVRVPPVETPRSVTVVYWHQGTMAASDQSTHAHIVGETLQKMAHQFAQEYRIDQPPEVQTTPIAPKKSDDNPLLNP